METGYYMKMNHLMYIMIFFSLINAENRLTLKQAERETVENNLSVHALNMEKESVKWQRLSTIGIYFPSFVYSGSYTHYDFNGPAPFMFPGMQQGSGFLGGFYDNTFSHQLSFNIPISNGGAEIAALRISRQTISALTLQLEDKKQQVILDIRTTYLNAVAAQEQIRVNQRSLGWARQNYNKALIKYEAEAISRSEVLRWEAEVFDRKVRLTESEADLRQLLLLLLLQMGRNIDTAYIKEVALDSLVYFEKRFDETFRFEALDLQEHPLFKALTFQEQVAKEQVRLSRAKLFPRLNGFYSMQWPADSTLVPQGQRYWMAGLRLDIPLVPGLSLFSDVKKSTTDSRRIEYVIEEKRRQLRVALEKSKAHAQAAHEEVEAARKRRDAMNETLTMMQDRYEGGLVNQTELLETALQTDIAQIGYIRTLFMYLIHKAEYFRSTGRLEVIE